MDELFTESQPKVDDFTNPKTAQRDAEMERKLVHGVPWE